MSKLVRESGQGIYQWNLHGDIQVISISMEELVSNLHNDKVQITRVHTRLFIRNTLKRHGLSGIHALLQINLQLNRFRLSLTIRTFSTVVSPHFTPCDTSIVALLDLLYESRCNLLHPDLDSRTLTLLVGFHTLLPVNAKRISHIFHFNGITQIQLFQRNPKRNIHVGRSLFPLPPPLSAPKVESKMRKDIIETTVSSAPSSPLLMLLQPLLTVSIINPLLLFIRQHLVRVGNLGELLRSPLLLVFVRVKFERFGSICLFYFLLGGFSRDAEEFVKVLCGVGWVDEEGGGEGEEG
mmetsp:Transcript_33/g.82  ORF Transcript_33/g.82 Transcript_33/m.82 type:complete len:295 (+) Transcript_33:386-1270(+)